MMYKTPLYTVILVTGDGTKYYVKGSGSANQTTSLTLSEVDGQLAQKAVIKLANFKVPGNKGGNPSALFAVKSKVYIYAKGAGVTKSTEVFRGFVWENKYTNKDQKEVTLTCYDQLIYLMNSQINLYISKGKDTKSVISAICKKWGIKLSYDYETIKHPKLPLSGSIADVLTGGVLKKVQDKKEKKYVIKSRKGILHITAAGKNKTVYLIDKAGRDGEIGYVRNTTMDGMVTKVIIAGSTDSNGKTKIEATESKNTKQYGTLQKVIYKEEDTKLKEAKTEAKQVLKDQAQPKKTYEDVEAMDIPWVGKGDKVGVCFSGKTMTYCIVKSVIHHVDTEMMMMDLEKAK